MTLLDSLRARPPDCKPSAAFSGLPAFIADDPTISPTDKVILLTLAGHAWAGKDTCWPSNATIAAKVGRTAGHVKRRLLVLEERGLIRREPTPLNRTGRQFRLLWRDPPAAPMPRPARASARPEALESQEKKKESGEGSGLAKEANPPSPVEETGEATASEADLRLWSEWANSGNQGLASFGRSALKFAGFSEVAADCRTPGQDTHSVRTPSEGGPGDRENSADPPITCPEAMSSPIPAEISTPPEGTTSSGTLLATPRPARVKGASSAPIPRRAPAAAAPSRRRQQHQGPRRLLEGAIGQGQGPLSEVRITPRLGSG